MSPAAADEQPGSSSAVVTLFESYGAGAEELGPRVAEALGVAYHPQAFSSDEFESAATRGDEGSLLTRVFGVMNASTYLGLEGRSIPTEQAERRELVGTNTRLVVSRARGGGVIVGRNGAFILADWPGAVHVKLDAPLEQRIRRAAREAGIGEAQAARRQRHEDQVRAEMSLSLYGWDPRDDGYYDLVLNTGRLSVEECVELVVTASRAKARAPHPA